MTSLASSYIHILKCFLFLLHEPLENRIVIYFSTFETSLPLEHSCASPSNGRCCKTHLLDFKVLLYFCGMDNLVTNYFVN